MTRYEIAGLQVDLEAGGRTAAQAEAYRAPHLGRPAHLTIRADGAALLARFPELETAELAEYLYTGDRFSLGLLSHGGMMLHASAVEYRGECVCFSAPPGVGKSTLAGRWLRLFGGEILNDDKPALRRFPEGWRAFGTPWSGKTDRNVNRSAPLAAVCFLFRGEENGAVRLSPGEALPLLLSQTPFRLDRENLERLLARADQLLNEIPAWRLTCRNDDSAAIFARETLFRPGTGKDTQRI